MTDADEIHAEAHVLVANESFYRAFSGGDVEAMGELWARGITVTCLHPGARLLRGRDAVMRSWASIFRGTPNLALQCVSPQAHVLGPVAWVTCYEAGGEQPAHLAATNVFVLEDHQWKLAHHHAGPMERPVRSPTPSSELN